MLDTQNITAGPRIVNGVLKWYEGDTFAILYTVDLYVNDSETSYTYVEGDRLVFSFYENKSNRLVYSFVFSTIPTTHEVVLDFTKDITNLFRPGLYSYSVKYMTNEGYDGKTEIITVGAKYKVEVERCHQ